jgi:VWFA-related protein
MRSRLTPALVSLAILSTALLAAPVRRATASAAPPSPQEAAIRVGVPLVNIYASVVDKHNANVPDLDQSDFKIFEDKVEQKIAFFSHEKTLPLSIGLLIDTSGSEEFMIDAEQRAATQFLHRIIQEGDKAFVVAFDVDAVMLSNWTSDLGVLDRAVDRAQAGIGGVNKLKPGTFSPYRGGTRLYDTIYSAAVRKMNSETGRKALIILTDANDNGSYVDLKQAIESAQRADTLVQVLVVYDKKGSADFDSAKHLAEDTGGRAIDVATQARLQKAFDQISDALRTEYSLGYYPSNENTDGKYRQLKLQLSSKKYKVFTRKGYYAKKIGK